MWVIAVCNVQSGLKLCSHCQLTPTSAPGVYKCDVHCTAHLCPYTSTCVVPSTCLKLLHYRCLVPITHHNHSRGCSIGTRSHMTCVIAIHMRLLSFNIPITLLRKVGFSGSSVWKTGLSCWRFGQSALTFFRAKMKLEWNTCHYKALHPIECCHWNCQLVPQVVGWIRLLCCSMQPSCTEHPSHLHVVVLSVLHHCGFPFISRQAHFILHTSQLLQDLPLLLGHVGLGWWRSGAA